MTLSLSGQKRTDHDAMLQSGAVPVLHETKLASVWQTARSRLPRLSAGAGPEAREGPLVYAFMRLMATTTMQVMAMSAMAPTNMTT